MNGQCAIVTGGASGIGHECALQLATHGANVIVADISDGSETVRQISDMGGQATFVRTDVSIEDDCDNLIAEASKKFGRLDVMVAAAGILGGAPELESASNYRSLIDTSIASWERLLTVNLTGTMLTLRAGARFMIESGGGSIVTIGSGASSRPIAGRAGYCTSKAGVWMLSKVLALELAQHNIRVNTVAPGYTATPMTSDLFAQNFPDDKPLNVPLGRFAHPREIANTVTFLASDASSFTTGKIFFVDGGVFSG